MGKPAWTIRLSGLAYEDTPRAPVEVRGKTVRWTKFQSQQAGESRWAVDDEGRRLVRSTIWFAVVLSSRQSRAASRLIRRAWLARLRDGSLDETEVCDARKRRRIDVTILVVCSVALLGTFGFMAWRFGASHTPGTPMWITVAGAAAVGGLPLFLVGAVVAAHMKLLRGLNSNVHRFRVTSDGIEADIVQRGVTRRAWSDLRHIRKESLLWVLTFADGEEIRVVPRRSRAVFAYLQEQLGQLEPAAGVPWRRVVAWWIGGCVFAGTAMYATGQSSAWGTVWRMTLICGLIGGMLWLLHTMPKWEPRVDEWCDRRRRRSKK